MLCCRNFNLISAFFKFRNCHQQRLLHQHCSPLSSVIMQQLLLFLLQLFLILLIHSGPLLLSLGLCVNTGQSCQDTGCRVNGGLCNSACVCMNRDQQQQNQQNGADLWSMASFGGCGGGGRGDLWP